MLLLLLPNHTTHMCWYDFFYFCGGYADMKLIWKAKLFCLNSFPLIYQIIVFINEDHLINRTLIYKLSENVLHQFNSFLNVMLLSVLLSCYFLLRQLYCIYCPTTSILIFVLNKFPFVAVSMVWGKLVQSMVWWQWELINLNQLQFRQPLPSPRRNMIFHP
jgi:hypothetical protein